MEEAETIFQAVTGKYLIAKIINTKTDKDLGGGMAVKNSELGKFRVAEVLEVQKDSDYSPGDYIITLPGRAEENFNLLGDKVVFIHPDDIIGILSNVKRLQVQKSTSSRNKR